MDSASQFLLGASIAGATLGSRLGGRALLIGGLVATLPDLDSFIPMGNDIDNMTYHRGFSHSVLVQTIVAPAVAYGITRLVRETRQFVRPLLITVWLCLVTHSLLDSLTTYGTQILGPLDAGPPVAWPAVFIIDPLYTLVLLIGVFGMAWAGGFLDNRILPLGDYGQILSAGAIPLIYTLIGLKVGAEFSSILESLEETEDR